MRIAVLGSGMAGQATAGKLAALGHDVTTGTRDVAATLARTEPVAMGPSLANPQRTRSKRAAMVAEPRRAGGRITL